MADFDLILELSPAALVEMIRPQLMLNGVNYNPPAEITVPIPEIQGGGELRLVLTDLAIRLGANAEIAIMIFFERGSLLGSSQGVFSSLRGTITINSRLTLDPVPMQPTSRALTLHLRRIVRPDMSVDGSFVTVLLPTAMPLALGIRIGIQQWVDNLTMNPSITLPFQVDPAASGSI